MGWLHSRRLRYGVGAIGLVFALLAALRLVFVWGPACQWVCVRHPG